MDGSVLFYTRSGVVSVIYVLQLFIYDMQLTKSDIEYIINEAANMLTQQAQQGTSLISTKKRKEDIKSLVKKHDLINIETIMGNEKCFIGFSVLEQKWYGICNDNIYGFEVGTMLHKNDCGYKYCPIKKARTLWDARRMAEAYVREAMEIERKDAQEMMR